MKKMFLFGAMVCAFGIFAACGEKNNSNDTLVGKWEYKTAVVHYINVNQGVDTTFNSSPVNSQTPIFDKVDFHADGTAKLYDDETWSWSLRNDTILLSYQNNDAGTEYGAMDMLWKIESLSSQELVATWQREMNGVAGTDIFITTTTFRRR